MTRFALLLIFTLLTPVSPILANDLFAEVGCGSSCRDEYYIIKGPLSGQDGLKKVLVKNVSLFGVPEIRKTRQVWILADCNNQMINMSSFSSSGHGSHADAIEWQRIERDGTNWQWGISQVYDKLCN